MTRDEADKLALAIRASGDYDACLFSFDRINDNDPDHLKIRLVINVTAQNKARLIGERSMQLAKLAEETLERPLSQVIDNCELDIDARLTQTLRETRTPRTP